MAYFGEGPDGCDFAFDKISLYVMMIKEKALGDAETVVEKAYPEQSIIASLRCIRLLAREFPKSVSIGMRRSDFEKLRSAFQAWYEAVHKKVPAKYREKIRAGADEEFRLFETEALPPKPGTATVE